MNFFIGVVHFVLLRAVGILSDGRVSDHFKHLDEGLRVGEELSGGLEWLHVNLVSFNLLVLFEVPDRRNHSLL